MLTKFQQLDLEKAILGYFLSKEYYQSLSSFVQESSLLKDSDFITLKEKEGENVSLNQINLFFKGIENIGALSSEKSSTYTNIHVN